LHNKHIPGNIPRDCGFLELKMELSYIANMNFQNVFEVLCYTVKALKEADMESEIADYLIEAISDSNYNLLQVSNDYLSKCFAATHKYGFNFSDFDSERCITDCDDCTDDLYDCVYSDKYYWSDDLICDDEEEMYEGFSTCKKTYWDSVIDDTEDNENEEIAYAKWCWK
jgi:hypothetical protein